MTGEYDGYRAASWSSVLCPLTLNILHDAVKAEDGNIYERAIMEWIRVKGAASCPAHRQADGRGVNLWRGRIRPCRDGAPQPFRSPRTVAVSSRTVRTRQGRRAHPRGASPAESFPASMRRRWSHARCEVVQRVMEWSRKDPLVMGHELTVLIQMPHLCHLNIIDPLG
jgi:hypothetical protein